jgi:hypothetical protein
MVRRDLPTDAMPAGRLTQYVVERYAPDLSLVANVSPFCANSGAADAAHGRGDPSADFQFLRHRFMVPATPAVQPLKSARP